LDREGEGTEEGREMIQEGRDCVNLGSWGKNFLVVDVNNLRCQLWMEEEFI
jgi:hypothetical protein